MPKFNFRDVYPYDEDNLCLFHEGDYDAHSMYLDETIFPEEFVDESYIPIDKEELAIRTQRSQNTFYYMIELFGGEHFDVVDEFSVANSIFCKTNASDQLIYFAPLLITGYSQSDDSKTYISGVLSSIRENFLKEEKDFPTEFILAIPAVSTSCHYGHASALFIRFSGLTYNESESADDDVMAGWSCNAVELSHLDTAYKILHFSIYLESQLLYWKRFCASI